MSEPVTIFHVITSLNLGGAETMMCQLLEHTDRTRFTPVVVSLRPASALAPRIEKAGITVHSLDMNSPLALFSGLAKLRQLMRQYQPALVQTWMYHADLLGAMAANSLSPRPPVVWNIQHGTMDPRSTKLLSLWLCRLLAPVSRLWPDKIVVCSRAAIATHAELGYAREKMIHIPNGADVERFKPDAVARLEMRKELGLPKDARVIGMAGRNNPQKDYPNFFAAIREFQKTDQGTHFIACGSGVTLHGAQLSALHAQCPKPELVHLIGPRQDMPRVYTAFDVATLSSAYGEGLPVTLCEAIACGLPGVVTDVGDSADVIGNCGQVVPPRDASALARAWRSVLDSTPDEMAALKQAARERAVRNYALTTITERYEALYNEILKPRPIPQPAALKPCLLA